MGHRLLSELGTRATREGRTESRHPLVSYFRSSTTTSFHKHQGWSATLSVVASGRKRAVIEGQPLVYETGKAMLVTGPAVYDTAVERASAAEPYLAVALVLPPDVVLRTLWNVDDTLLKGKPARALVVDLSPDLEDVVMRLVRAADDPEDLRLLAPLYLQELVVRLLRSEAGGALVQAVRRDGDGPRISRAMAFIEENLAQPLTVAAMADHVGMSPSHFAHRFRDWAQTTPIQYHKQVRLYRGRELLVEHGLRVGEAAERVGYSNASVFSREFRGFFQIAPRELLQQMNAPQESSKGRQDSS